MVASSKQDPWDLPLNHPIEIGQDDRRLATLGEVGAYILGLPEAVKRQELWCAAAEIVLEAAKSGDTARVPLVFHMAALMSGQPSRSVLE
jgi:hypothetical protein